MNARLVAPLAALLAMLPLQTDVFAKGPDPALSYEDPCIVACPGGDSTFVVAMRNAANIPTDPYEWSVFLDFCGCPDLHVAPTTDHDPYVTTRGGCMPYMAQGQDALTMFPLRLGGRCAEARVFGGRDSLPYILLAYRPVATFDQNGDLTVDDADIALIAAKVGTNDRTADFDCDGAVTDADVEIARGHLGHTALITAVLTHSWGHLKTIYR